jgi:hypothetical protein
MKKLKCHCGEIEAEINIKDNLEKILRCNCSLCKRKGAVMSMVKNEDFKIIKGLDKLKMLSIIFAQFAVFTLTTTQGLTQQ